MKKDPMSIRSVTFIKAIFLLVFSVFSFFYISEVIRPEILFHNQQPAFFMDWNFFSGYLNYPGGLSEYAAGLISQSFAFNEYGSLTMVFFIATFIFASFFLFKDIKNLAINIFMSFAPAILLIFLLSDYFFPFSIAFSIFSALLFAAILKIFISNKITSSIYLFIISPFLYYAIGSGAFGVFALSGVFLLFHHYGFSKSGLVLLLPVFYIFILPLPAYYYFFNIRWERVFFAFIPDLPLVLKFNSSSLLFVFAFFVPAILFVFSLFTHVRTLFSRNKDSLQKSKTSFFHKDGLQIVVCFIALSALGYLVIFDKKHTNQKELILTDYYNYNGKWNEAVELIKSVKDYNVILDYQYVRAIGNNGQLANDFFKYPKYIGSDVLFPDKLNTSSLAVFSSEYYYDIGFISESMHWAYEAKSIMPYNTRVIKQLVKTNLIMGNYAASEMFLGVLEKSLLCKQFVMYYKALVADTTLILRDSEITGKRKIMPKNILVPEEIGDRFKILLEADSSNIKACEYLQLYYLLNHRLGNFFELYNKSKFQYHKIPQPFEEALFILLIRQDSQIMNKYPISETTKTMISGYTKIMKQFDDKKADAKESLYAGFRDTYMYYLFYDSPLVTKAALGTREVKEYQN